ncbi:MAG: phosphonate ABC transporter substrate-binding protein [Betaproteobacteria bacterium RIFCSPLOWO2_02_FULL_65_24]|nr:MAG: phosphonate ABC transporter substrate-binding protein [Betaproteobacteria bacterium RIFCSPLOWO2_02_FULL_65_24]OGA35921.1 MAG: phosphonate ABC transporter substrate-binding protein [Betaproteobacteria bacterium RIFCSPLOWO2_12_FULL_62_13b]
MHRLKHLLSSALVALACAPSFAQDSCKHRGELDTPFCDEDGDLLADTPKDAKRQKNPDPLFFTNSPLEDPAVFKELMRPFVEHLAQCTGRKVRFYDVYSSAAAIEAMRSGRMHLGTMSSGDTVFAVNVAGAIPFGIRGDTGGPQGYQLWVIVKKGSPYRKLSDLKEKRVAHTTPSSNSGNLAPRTLFPAEGLTPDKDYKVVFSGKHENSVSGVASGDFDAAPIAHDILLRMADRGLVRMDDFRIIWKSRNFPPGGLSMAHDLAPALQHKIRECTYNYTYSPEMVRGFQGADRWLPIDYKQDWELIRRVARESGQAFTRTAFEREKTRAEAAGKK